MRRDDESKRERRWKERMKMEKNTLFWCVFFFYIIATSKIISGRVQTHGDFIVLPPLGNQATSTMTWYHTQSHYPDTKPTSPCPIQIMPSAWLGSGKYSFLTLWFDSTRVWTRVVRIPWSPKIGDGCSNHLAIPSGGEKQACAEWRESRVGGR